MHRFLLRFRIWCVDICWSFAYIFKLWINLFLLIFFVLLIILLIPSVDWLIKKRRKKQRLLTFLNYTQWFSLLIHNTTCNIFTINPSLKSSKTLTLQVVFFYFCFLLRFIFQHLQHPKSEMKIEMKHKKIVYSTLFKLNFVQHTKLCGRLIGQFECDMHVHWTAKKWRNKKCKTKQLKFFNSAIVCIWWFGCRWLYNF